MATADHIQVRILKNLGLIVHHGIDLGDGTGVHFYKKEFAKKPVIARTSLSDFGDGLAYTTVRHIAALPDNEVISRALWLLDRYNKGEYEEYSALENNCEHIANWCKTREFKSIQADNAKSLLKSMKDYVKNNKMEIAHMAITTFKAYK